MTCKGVVFDFNGTLFWDTESNNEAWVRFLEDHGLRLSEREVMDIIHGHNNQDSIRLFFGNELEQQEVDRLSVAKEHIYQELCRQRHDALAPGAVELLTYLRQRHIPFTIASASIKENIDFYFAHLGLGAFFDRDKVVYNDGKIKSKPDPEYYLKAMQVLGLHPADTMVFEDSPAGITSAERAGVGRIVIVDSHHEDLSQWNHPVIRNFNEIDKQLFN